jgi:hypothetical protein
MTVPVLNFCPGLPLTVWGFWSAKALRKRAGFKGLLGIAFWSKRSILSPALVV